MLTGWEAAVYAAAMARLRASGASGTAWAAFTLVLGQRLKMEPFVGELTDERVAELCGGCDRSTVYRALRWLADKDLIIMGRNAGGRRGTILLAPSLFAAIPKPDRRPPGVPRRAAVHRDIPTLSTGGVPCAKTQLLGLPSPKEALNLSDSDPAALRAALSLGLNDQRRTTTAQRGRPATGWASAADVLAGFAGPTGTA